jgi:CBS domain-containing protein
MAKIALETLITFNPWSVDRQTPLEVVVRQFELLGCHHVAVVGEDRELVGILSETDVLRVRQRQAVLVGAGGDGEFAESVGDAMTAEVISIGADLPPRDILQLLLSHRIHALPVVEQGRLVGMITSLDFIRELSYGELDCSREPVGKLLRPPPEPIEPATTLDRALLQMHEAGADCLVVAQGGCPLGLVTQRDIVRARCQAESEADVHGNTVVLPTVARIMRRTTPVRPGQRLFEAALAMVQDGAPAAVVMNQANRLVGVISEDDLLRVLCDHV